MLSVNLKIRVTFLNVSSLISNLFIARIRIDRILLEIIKNNGWNNDSGQFSYEFESNIIAFENQYWIAKYMYTLVRQQCEEKKTIKARA